MSIDRQKLICGTSDGRGSPEYTPSNTFNQRVSTGLANGKGPAVDSTSPPNPLKASKTTSGFLRRNAASVSRNAVSLRDRIVAGDCVFSVCCVAAEKSAKSNLYIRIPRSYQYCNVCMKSGRKPPSYIEAVHFLLLNESFQAGAGSIFTSILVPNHKPGRIPWRRHSAIHLLGPLGQFGLRHSRYPPSGAN